LDVIGFGDPVIGGFAHGLHGALDALQDVRLDYTGGVMGYRTVSQLAFWSRKGLGLEGKSRLDGVCGAQEASKSLQKNLPPQPN
jgi:hypothetical protein